MDTQTRPEIVAQDHAYIYSTKGIGLNDDPPGPEHGDNVAGPFGVAPADDYPSPRFGRIGIAEEDHIEALTS